MERREFLFGIATVVIGAAAGCGGGTSTSPTSPGFDVTSNVVNAHSHRIRVLDADLAAPPAAGAAYTTTIEAGHTHIVALAQADLAAIAAGQTVTALSSLDVAHQHAFVIRRP